MKDNEPILDQEQKFILLRDEIVTKLKKSCPIEVETQCVCVSTRETDGGTIGLYLSSDGNWSGRVQMAGWPMEINPSIESLLNQYALTINDRGYKRLLNKGEEKMNKYVLKNKNRLLSGLLKEMDSTLKTWFI